MSPLRRRTVPVIDGPSLFWPLVTVALWRLVYGVDGLFWHGSPALTAAGGRPFSIGWGIAVIAANGAALAGVIVSAASGRRRERLELAGNLAVLALGAGFVAAVVWNATHTLPAQGLVVAWQVPALNALAGWRIVSIAQHRRAREVRDARARRRRGR